MAFAGKNVLILGASGVVGSGAAVSYLDQGASIYYTSRDASKINELKEKLTKLNGGYSGRLHGIVASFDTEAQGVAAKAAVLAALNGKSLDHVVSVLGFARVVSQGASQSPLSDLTGAFEDSLYPTFIAGQVFLPLLKDRAGASYVIVSGGFAHMTPSGMAGAWPATVKNAALNALVLGYSTEYEKSAVRIYSACIHFGVSPIGGEKNQFGWPSGDTRKLGPFFPAIALATKEKSRVICLQSFEEVDKLIPTLQH